MLNLRDIRQDKELLAAIDWEITPWEAFETYQLKSVGNWKRQSTAPVVYFYLSTWKGRPKVYLVRRSLKQSEEIAAIEPPERLARAALKAEDGSQMPRGQLPLDQGLKNWLRSELGL